MFELQPPDYVRTIAAHLALKTSQIAAALRLLDDGNTIPFIARYRKEMTGELDENQLRSIASKYDFEQSLYERKADVLRLLEEKSVFAKEPHASQLFAAIKAATTLTEVDDIYRPYRPKRKTRASVAKERGLDPLTKWLKQVDPIRTDEAMVVAYATQFVDGNQGIATPLEALAGASDIFAEDVADDAQTRQWVRAHSSVHGRIRSVAVDATVESVYEAYYDYEEPVASLPPHRLLAINRGERQGLIKVTVVVEADAILDYLRQRHVSLALKGITELNVDAYVYRILGASVADAYKRLIAPAIEREIRADLTVRAEAHAIHVFGKNLKNLLMQPPIRGRIVLGVDPAYRTGCKLAVVDDTGKLLEVCVIYPTPPQSKVAAAEQEIIRLFGQYDIAFIAIGNGTASRETEAFIANCTHVYRDMMKKTIPYVLVSEAGASVYSASVLAGEEFPDLDVSERSAISIARRIQDPLAELVKIDPKSVGVGQYQHDVAQKKLDEQLAVVVETAVNQVGVDVNTASPSLLSHVAGLNKTVARNIVAFRELNGRFRSRQALTKVPRLGQKTLEQCLGFLRIANGDEVLDATPIHPESYGVVLKLLARTGLTRAVISVVKERTAWLQELRSVPMAILSVETGVGIPTLRDILQALEQPGRDPREDAPPLILRTDILKLEDIEVGMVLTGTVRNVVDFGAFVDIGIKNDGLVHISELSNRFIKSPLDVVAVGDIVRVRVIQIDMQRHRLGLSMKGNFDVQTTE